MERATATTSDTPVWLLPDNATLEQKVLHFQAWIHRANASKLPHEKKLNDYASCPAHLVVAYMEFMHPHQHPVDEERLASICTCPKKVRKSGNGAPTGAFAFTITKSPKDPYSVGDMVAAVKKVMTQKSCPVAKYAWYYEDKGRDENGDPIHPHIHGMYETAAGGRIERKHFKRAWEIWGEGDRDARMGAGFRGGYHRPVKSEEGYSDYIKKGGGMHESFGMDEQTE